MIHNAKQDGCFYERIDEDIIKLDAHNQPGLLNKAILDQTSACARNVKMIQ